jgi:hypothetical protein
VANHQLVELAAGGGTAAAFQGMLEAVYADGGARIADETRNQVVVAAAAIVSVHRLGA